MHPNPTLDRIRPNPNLETPTQPRTEAIVRPCVLDFDHGPFAHQALPFDLYSGSKQYPQKVQVQEDPLIISMRTAAVEGKLPNAIKWGDAKVANEAVKEGTGSPATAAGAGQGLTLVHFSAQRKRFRWDWGCIYGRPLFSST